MHQLCLGLFFVSLALCVPLSWWLIGWGHRRGKLDVPGQEGHKGHAHAVPHTGGVAIFASIVVPMTAIILVVWLIDRASWVGWFAPLAPHIAGLRGQTGSALAVLTALAVLHVLGLIDDRRGLGASAKLAVQLIVALLLAGVFEIRVLQVLEGWGPAGVAASVVISALWMVAITNAMNMLDNMDGLAGGVAAIIAALYLAATLIGGQWFIAALAALLLGALIGFLVFNFPPAKLFMGDGGSLVIGMLLAIISVRTTYYLTPEVRWAGGTGVPGGAGGPGDAAAIIAGTSWYAALMPLVIMAVPLYDLVSVSLIRLRQGRNPFVGDQQHFSHRLVQRGMSRRTAVMVIWLATAATGLGGVMFGSLAPWQAVLVAGQTAAVIAVLAMLEYKR